MREEFNSSFLLINEISEIKQKISNILDLIDTIEKAEETCGKDNENIASVIFSYTYLKNSSPHIGDVSINNLLSTYIGSNFYQIIGEIKKEKNKEIENLTLELKEKTQQLELATGDIV